MGETFVVTTFGPHNDSKMGRAFIDNFLKFWPQDFKLIVYYEEPFDCPKSDRVITGSLFSYYDGLQFILRHKDESVVKGLKPHAWHAWMEKEKKDAYTYRFDAFKFCRKVFAIFMAQGRLKEGDVLWWVDADIVTHQAIPAELFENIFPENFSLSYLHRKGRYPETGLVGFRVNDRTRKLIQSINDVYVHDKFLYYTQWHDAWIFGAIKDFFIPLHLQYLIPCKHDEMDVFDSCPLAKYSDHLKGGNIEKNQ